MSPFLATGLGSLCTPPSAIGLVSELALLRLEGKRIIGSIQVSVQAGSPGPGPAWRTEHGVPAAPTAAGGGSRHAVLEKPQQKEESRTGPGPRGVELKLGGGARGQV